MSEVNQRPIIIIKKKGGHGGHHGGAWKVAYADFVTAMMSLFIVLWLLNSTPQVKKAIAGYFNDPKGTSKMMGTDMLGSGPSVSIDKTNVSKLQEAIKKAIIQQKELEKLKDQIDLKMTDEGLRIELIEGKNGSFFVSGSPKLTPAGVELLSLIGGQLKPLPNHLLLEGHTDAKGFGAANGYGNWELSSDRANSARRLLQADGVRPDQVSQVRGYADQNLRVPDSPLDPSNRRVSIVVQFLAAPEGTKGQEVLGAGAQGAEKEGGEAKAGGEEKPAAEGKTPEKEKPAEAQPVSGRINLPSKPGADVPHTGKIDLPAKPSAGTPTGKSTDKLGEQLTVMRQMKQSDAAAKPK